MGAPVLQFKRGQFSNLPGLRAGEPGFTTDKFDLYVGIDSTTSNNKFFGSHRYWNRETATVGSSVRVVEGSNNGSNYIELKSPNSLGGNVSYTLPGTDVANGILVSDGSGNLSYTTTVTGSGSGLSAGSVPLTSLDIDGGTDIGADLADGDLLIVDDGAGGTNRKTAMSRVKTYVLGGGAGASFGAINVSGIGTVGFVDSQQLKVSGVSTFTGTVDINGAIDADGGANIAGGETVLSSATVSDLTDNRVVIAGSSGALEDSANLTFDGTTFTVGGSTGIVAADLRNSSGGLNALVGVSSASSHAGLVTSFKFRGGGLENFIVADGVADIVMSGIAATTFTTSQTITATANQTTFTVASGYSNGFIDVYLNGVRLITGTDYTATNGSTVVLGTGATAGDEVELVAWKSLGNLVSVQSLTTAADLTVTGVATATGGFVGNLTGNVTGSGANLTAGTVPLSALDIDGGTATTTLADADLFIVDDGAGGTNRKVTFEKISDSILGGSGGATFAAVSVTGLSTFTGAADFNGGADISGGSGLVASTAKISDLTDNRVVIAGSSGELEDSGNLTFNGSTLAVTGAITASGNVTVSGNLQVDGTTTQLNTTNTTVEDVLLELQKVDGGNLSSDTNKDVGLVMNYYDGSAKKAAFFWDDSAGRFAFGSVVTENAGVLSGITYGGVEIGSLYVNDCAGASQVISCSGTTRSLENITIDGGSF